jgi:hypothetical protein
MDPPCHALVLLIDEKSGIQALDRTQPGCRCSPAGCGTIIHDYKRDDTVRPQGAADVVGG